MATADTSITELRVDVSSALPFTGETNTMSATVHEPEGPPRAVLVCWPGGSYDRSYWQFDANPGYSFAAHMTAQGFAVVAGDPLGVGASSRPADVDAVGLEAMAAAQAALTPAVRERFPGVPVVGVGHSLGGCLTVIAQAQHGGYDRIACLGFTHGSKAAVTVDADDAAADPRAVAEEQAKAFFADWDAGYAIAPREPSHSWLYRPNTPADVVAADDATVAAWPRQAYVEVLTAGSTVGFAGGVTCPLFLGYGDHDIPERPHDEVAYYTGSRDVALFVVEDAAHCHNFASSRAVLWDRIGAFAVNE